MGENMWDYFFEPVAGYTYEDIQSYISDPNHPLTESNLVYLDNDVLSYLHGGNPDGIYNYRYGYYAELDENPNNWYHRQRQKAQALVKKYIHVKQELNEQLEQFANREFNGQHILGVHIRGTDKSQLDSIKPPEKYFPHIDAYLQQHPDSKIFLATDQSQFVTQMHMKYPGRIITQDVIRSESRTNSFQKQDDKGYQKGKEVLLDCLLLSRCQYLFKCASAVSEYAHYFNPALNGMDLDEYYRCPNTYQKLRTLFLVEPYAFMRGGCRIISDKNRSFTSLFWYLLTDYPLVRRLFNRLEDKQFSGNLFLLAIFLLKKYVSLRRHKEEIPFRQIKQLALHSRARRGAEYYSFDKAKGKKYLEIRTDGDPQAAFFAQYLYVLQQIRFARTHHLIPVVNLDHSFNYYYDSSYSKNVWENYFEPINGISAIDLAELPPESITFLRPEEQRQLFLGDGDEPPLEYNVETRQWWQRQRAMGAQLTAQYIRVRTDILQQVEDYYHNHFKDHIVIGVHLRGTDKSTRFDGTPFLGPKQFTRIVPPEEYFPFLDKFISHYPDGKLFVATDQYQFMQTIIGRYGSRVMHTRATRSSTKKAVFSRSGKGYQRGIEVLLDSLLLSKCHFLIKSFSNVGEVATYFNPDMPVIDIFYPNNINDFETFFIK
jgi:hypothetical protein